MTPSGTGVYVSLAGYVGITAGWVEGFELNFLGAVLGFDVRRPALKLLVLGASASQPPCKGGFTAARRLARRPAEPSRLHRSYRGLDFEIVALAFVRRGDR